MIAAAVGGGASRWQLLLTTAARVGAVNALLIGLGAALLTGVSDGSPTLAIALGVAVALLAFAAQLAFIKRASIRLSG
ncbi:hypothetical protein ACGF5C_27895 [Micromonospora sp. NPDC047620]|uniref:hypothetical protein n=1 Tax=Micromonospora sp. NPDC047620 TaxID=3364251 RepID=UPI0037102ECF